MSSGQWHSTLSKINVAKVQPFAYTFWQSGFVVHVYSCARRSSRPRDAYSSGVFQDFHVGLPPSKARSVVRASVFRLEKLAIRERMPVYRVQVSADTGKLGRASISTGRYKIKAGRLLVRQIIFPVLADCLHSLKRKTTSPSPP